jgi:hypothetical protein
VLLVLLVHKHQLTPLIFIGYTIHFVISFDYHYIIFLLICPSRTQVFSTIVQLVPLAPASDLRALRQQGQIPASETTSDSPLSPPNAVANAHGNDPRHQVLLSRREYLHRRKEKHQRDVLAHLVLGVPLPPQFVASDLDSCLQPHVRK